MEKTYIMIKPDGVQRGFIGRIISRFEEKGFKLVGLKMLLAEESVLDEHYAELMVCLSLPGLELMLEVCRTVPSTPACWTTSGPGPWWPWSGRATTWWPSPDRCWEPPTQPTRLQEPSGKGSLINNYILNH